MAYTKKQKREIFAKIIDAIADDGIPIRKILQEQWAPSTSTFFNWLDEDDKMASQYAKACEIRAEMYFEEMIEVAFTPEVGETVEISQKGEKGIKEFKRTKGDMLGHRRLKVDTLKFVVARMLPKKYGNKIDLTSMGEKIEANSVPIVLEDGRSYEQLKNELKPE